MTSHRAMTSGLVVLLFVATTARAQVPAIPGAAGAGLGAGASGGTAAASAVPAAGAAPQTLWGFLGLSKQNLAACKLKFCRSSIGKSLGGFAAGPLGAVTGGLFADCCPPPTAGEIAALEAAGGPQGAQAVAAKIQADEADAKARVAAVDYLGTVDCRYWKEAQIALLNALRADRNECVRFAAARAFNNGCCCSKEVIETLRIVVAGEDSDGFPAESSMRIKATSFSALQNCLMKVPPTLASDKPLEPEHGPQLAPVPAEPGLTPEGAATSSNDPNEPDLLAASHLEAIPYGSRPASTGSAKAAVGLSVFEARVRFKSFASTVADAQKTLEEVAQSAPPVGVGSVLPAGKQSVLQALLKARQDLAASETVRQASIASDVPAEMIPPQPPLPALQPAPSQAERTKTETFPAPDRPVVPVNLQVVPAPSASRPSVSARTPQSGSGTVMTIPKLPSLSLPASESPKSVLAKALKPYSTPAAVYGANESASVRQKSFAAIDSPKRDSGLAEASSSVRVTPYAPRAAKPAGSNALSSLNRFPESYSAGSSRTGGMNPPTATPSSPRASQSADKIDFRPTPAPAVKPKSSKITGSDKNSSGVLIPSAALPKTDQMGSKPLASVFGARPRTNLAQQPKPPVARSEGSSVLGALIKARRGSSASPDTSSGPKAGYFKPTGTAAKPASRTIGEVSLDKVEKTDTSTAPASYWGKPKSAAGVTTTGNDEASSPGVTKRLISKLFTDRSE